MKTKDQKPWIKCMKLLSGIHKFCRYVFLYGVRRSIAKAGFQLKPSFLTKCALTFAFLKLKKPSQKRIVIIGLGMHGFSTIAFFLNNNNYKLSVVIDPNEKSGWLANKILKARFYTDLSSAIAEGEFHGDILYIASDHASHLDYALAAERSFKSVYIEKPLITSLAKRDLLRRFAVSANTNIFTGYNRPHARFFEEFCNSLNTQKFSCIMIVNGHFLAQDHWYRDAKQGSRILGNCTHWIDLALRILMKNDPALKEILIGVRLGIDDCVSIDLRTQIGNCITINFAAFKEPKNGVEEFIYWNSETSIGNIINFQNMTISDYSQHKRTRKISKDVGHEKAVLKAVTTNDNYKDMVGIHSALLAVDIEDAVRTGNHNFTYYVEHKK